MGILDLLRKHGGGSNPRAAKAARGMPPAGARVPGVGDGKTRTDRKVKLDPKPKREGKHRS